MRRLCPASVQFSSGIRLWIFMTACLRAVLHYTLLFASLVGFRMEVRWQRIFLCPGVCTISAHIYMFYRGEAHRTPLFAVREDLGVRASAGSSSSARVRDMRLSVVGESFVNQYATPHQALLIFLSSSSSGLLPLIHSSISSLCEQHKTF